MEKRDNQDGTYEIICNIPENQLNGINLGNRQEIGDVKRYLKRALSPTKCKRIKQLRGPVSHLFEAYIGNKALRLLFTINEDSHKIFIEKVGNRTMIFKGSRLL